MFNTEMVSMYLRQIGKYPYSENEKGSGLKIAVENDCLILSGNQIDLIDMADLLASLALSGKNTGQHFHIDTNNLVADDSSVQNLILERND